MITDVSNFRATLLRTLIQAFQSVGAPANVLVRSTQIAHPDVTRDDVEKQCQWLITQGYVIKKATALGGSEHRYYVTEQGKAFAEQEGIV